jgi:hypothetical protein
MPRWRVDTSKGITAVGIRGVTDPDGDPVTIRITSIMQDEPANTAGDGNTSCDATGIGGSLAQLRSERAGSGNGRFYHLFFAADDGHGGVCTGAVKVAVPHDRSKTPGRRRARVHLVPLT